MYTVRTSNSVTREVSRFDNETRHYWSALVAEIAANPFPRFGHYIEEPSPLRGLPMRTFNYEIAEELSVSGERLMVCTAEFFPVYVPVYVVNEDLWEVVVIYLRESRWV